MSQIFYMYLSVVLSWYTQLPCQKGGCQNMQHVKAGIRVYQKHAIHTLPLQPGLYKAPSSLSLPIIPSTSSTLTPAFLVGGSITLTVFSRTSVSSP